MKFKKGSVITVTLNLQKYKVALNTLYRILLYSSKEMHLIMFFAGFQCHVIQNKNQNCAIDKVQNLGKKREGKYADSTTFRSQQFFVCKICREPFVPKFIEICMETPC